MYHLLWWPFDAPGAWRQTPGAGLLEWCGPGTSSPGCRRREAAGIAHPWTVWPAFLISADLGKRRISYKRLSSLLFIYLSIYMYLLVLSVQSLFCTESILSTVLCNGRMDTLGLTLAWYTPFKKSNATRLWSIIFLLSWMFIPQVWHP